MIRIPKELKPRPYFLEGICCIFDLRPRRLNTKHITGSYPHRNQINRYWKNVGCDISAAIAKFEMMQGGELHD